MELVSDDIWQSLMSVTWVGCAVLSTTGAAYAERPLYIPILRTAARREKWTGLPWL